MAQRGQALAQRGQALLCPMVLTQKSLAEAVICQRFLFKMNAITASGYN
jgi:hypothetical protein